MTKFAHHRPLWFSAIATTLIIAFDVFWFRTFVDNPHPPEELGDVAVRISAVYAPIFILTVIPAYGLMLFAVIFALIGRGLRGTRYSNLSRILSPLLCLVSFGFHYFLLWPLITTIHAARHPEYSDSFHRGTPSVVPDDPNDETVAVFGFDHGKQAIKCGKLHSRRFKNLCTGDYPSVSPSGKFVAYNIDEISNRTTKVIEVNTGKISSFTSMPHGLVPSFGSAWSADEKFVAFQSNLGWCVLNIADGSFWNGTETEFSSKYSGLFGPYEPDQRRSSEGRLSVENYKHVGALFFHPTAGGSIRLTPEDMGVFCPIWIERTREALFVAVHTHPPYGEDDVTDGTVYLIKPEARDWANASKKEWENAIVTSGEQVSASR